MLEKYQLIQSYDTAKELNERAASLMIEAFKKPGLVLLPVGKTYEEGIYPLVDDYFKLDQIDLADQGIQHQHQVHSELKLSHLDELIGSKISFAADLKKALPSVMDQVGRNFMSINTNNFENFDRYIKMGGGPHTIFFGLGPDPATAHVAFIGEDFINTTTTVIELAETASKEYDCKTAVTIGTDIIDLPGVENIVVVAKGPNKAASLKAAFEDPDTGLGYLIAKHSNKLTLLADSAALRDIR